MSDSQSPIGMVFAHALTVNEHSEVLRTFQSYSFDRSMLTPAAAFRFTAYAVGSVTNKFNVRDIGSGDWAYLYATDANGREVQLATGIVDETDAHGTAHSIEFSVTGRDLIGQLVDNSAVDKDNRIVNTERISMDTIIKLILANTRCAQGFKVQQPLSNQLFNFQTNAGETKLNTLQRYLDYVNCILWSLPDGQIIIGKPNFYQASLGYLRISATRPTEGDFRNNIIEYRVRRNLNQAIRQIVYQLSTMNQVDAAAFTIENAIPEMREVLPAFVGRSVYMNFTYAQGNDGINQVDKIGNQSASPKKIGDTYALREMAADNVKILDIEVIVRGHVNSRGIVYNIDQCYDVFIEEENVQEKMFVYAVTYELTEKMGMTTRLRLCKLGSLVDGAFQWNNSFSGNPTIDVGGLA